MSGYLEWLVNNNERWGADSQAGTGRGTKVADPETGERRRAFPAVIKMAEKAGMRTATWWLSSRPNMTNLGRVDGDEKSGVTKHLHELGQAGISPDPAGVGPNPRAWEGWRVDTRTRLQ